MTKNNNETSVIIKPAYQRHISIDENIHATLSHRALALYMAFRFEADFRKEDSEVKRSAQYMYTKAKLSRAEYYRCLNEIEDAGLVLRDPANKLGDICIFHVARELRYFTRGSEGVSDGDRGVSDGDTDQYSSSGSNINITTSESGDSVAVSPSAKKNKNLETMWAMIAVYREVFPDNPQPHPRVISTSLQKTLQSLIKRWPELDPAGKAFDIEAFRRYMSALRTSAPKFSLLPYETQNGNRKKNNMETFCRWNTLVKFLENAYS